MAIRNYHDSGNHTHVRLDLAELAVILRPARDATNRRPPSPVSPSPRSPTAHPELNTAIAHLREVLGDQTYESLAHKGETMTTAAMVTYAYDQIDQARAELNAVSKYDIRVSRKSVSESPVRIPLKSLAAEPAFHSFGDCLPSRLKHHHVAHAGEELGVSLVSPRRSRHLPVSSRAVVCCAKNKQRCGHRASIGKTYH